MTMLDSFMLAVDATNRAAANDRRATDSTYYDAWGDLISFVPPASLQQEIISRGARWFFNRIDQANGLSTNCDFYSVLVHPAPAAFPTPGDLLEHVRVHLRDFLDVMISDFVPYEDAIDKPRWEGANPLGALLTFDINLVPAFGAWTQVEDATVVCTAYDRGKYWRFSTLHSAGDYDHPVSGHREWGVRPHDSGGFLLYTRGADRVTGNPSGVFPEDVVFNGGHKLWLSFQAKVADFVNTGGAASVQTPVTNRPAWQVVQDLYIPPPDAWL